MVEKFSAEIDGDVVPLSKGILVTDLESGDRVTSSGIIIPDDDGKERGIRPRWCQVYKVGKEITEVSIGEWILVDHGRWSRGVKIKKADGDEKIVRMVDGKDILLSSTEKPSNLV